MESTTIPKKAASAAVRPLDIVVPYTTPDLTRLALKKAVELSSEVHARIRVVRMQRVPFPLALDRPSIAVKVLREQTQKVADMGLEPAEVVIYLTREPEETLLQALRPDSIVVIASERRWWRTSQERLKRLCVRHGHEVALIYA